MRRQRFALAAAAISGLLAFAGCGSSSSSSSSSSVGGASNAANVSKGGSLTFATFNPYSGPDASFGPELGAGCPSATRIINAAGGVMGHTVNCISVDTRGDPADAVPAAAQMLASNGNLAGILGPSSDEAAATVPRINAAHVPMFADTGQALFDHSTYPYFWRIVSPDDATGYAEALYAFKSGHRRAALVYGNDISAEGTVPTIISGFKKLGGQVVLNQPVQRAQSSYRSEVEQLIAAKPDVIFNELDPQTAATYFSELKQLNGQIPILISTAAQYTPWIKAVSGAIGTATLAKIYHTVLNTALFSGPAYQQYKDNLLASPSVSNPKQWLQDSFSESGYDTVMTVALAMLASHSTNSTVYNAYIPKVTNVAGGGTVCHTWATCSALLKQGKQIAYVGASGEIAFDQWHNSAGGFEVLGFAGANGQQPIVAQYGPEAIRSLSS
jgi:ABC-type branched-subunit amino acid transport system substrate-binding protein